MSNDFSTPNQDTVIVRSFGDEPVVLRAVGSGPVPGRVLVAGRRSKRPISIPREEVYPYSERLFQRLQRAWRDGDFTGLEKLNGEEKKWTNDLQ